MSKISLQPSIEVALFEPEIPQNTGNIGRLCVGFDAKLSLIGKLGFDLTEKKLRRAGLDYWKYLKWESFKDFSSFFDAKKEIPIYLLSKFSKKCLYHQTFQVFLLSFIWERNTGFPR